MTLSCLQYLPNEDKDKALMFSGFLVEYEGLWFYVTAGHILEGIRKAQSAGAEFDRWRLDDSTAGNRFNGFAIPIDFRLEDWMVIRNEDLGIDYATLPLMDIYRQQLSAGGTVPLGPAAWGSSLDDHEAWALIGIPAESVTFDGVTELTASVVTVPLKSCPAPVEAKVKTENQFYATFAASPEGFVEDIDGMSGGPVFSLHKDEVDAWTYKVIGVQSAWYKSQKILAICPFDAFGTAIAEVINEARRLSETQGSE